MNICTEQPHHCGHQIEGLF